MGGDGWGNQQLEFYTDRPENARLDGDGALVIDGSRESSRRTAMVSRRDYTSARLKTQGLFEQAYGRFEARMKLPARTGHLARVLDARARHHDRRLAGLRRDRHHGEHRPRAGVVHGTLHGPGLLGRERASAPPHAPAAAASRTTSTCSRSSGSRTAALVSSTAQLYQTRTPAACRRARAGSSTTRSSCC